MAEPNSHLTTVHTADVAEGETTTLAQSVATQHRGGVLRPTRSLTALLGVAALGFGLAACGDTEDKEVIGAGTASASAEEESASPSAEAEPEDSNEYEPATPEHPARNVPKPVLPEVAKEETLEGAREFMNYWAETYNYLIQTGDGSYINEATHPESEYFEDYQLYEDAYKQGEWIAGRHWTMTVPEIEEDLFTEIDGQYNLLVQMERTKGEVYSSEGYVEEIPEEKFNSPHMLYISYENGGWLMKAIGPVPGANDGEG